MGGPHRDGAGPVGSERKARGGLALVLTVAAAVAAPGGSPSAWLPGLDAAGVSGLRAPAGARAQADTSLAPPTPAAELYESVCAHCHGRDGRGRAPLPPYPPGSEQRFFRGVLDGNARNGMPPFRGLVSDAELRGLLEHVRSLRTAAVPGGGDGGQLYASLCASCHGSDGRGTRLGPALRGYRGSDAEFQAVVRDGRPGTPMVPFGRVLDARQIAAIRSYLRTLDC